MITKICSTCNIEKPVTDFHVCKGHSFDRLQECKICKNSKMKIRHFSEEAKAFRKSRKGKEKAMLAYKRMVAKYPEKRSARERLRYAIRVGKIIRLSCMVCGEKNAHAHHEDYSKPFEVLWLCRTHHNMKHAGSLLLSN